MDHYPRTTPICCGATTWMAVDRVAYPTAVPGTRDALARRQALLVEKPAGGRPRQADAFRPRADFPRLKVLVGENLSIVTTCSTRARVVEAGRSAVCTR